METLKSVRLRRGLSQRLLARRASISFKGLQLMEQPRHDPRIGSLEKLAIGLGLAPGGIRRVVERFLWLHPDSVEAVGFRICHDGDDSWPLHLFGFVDGFRATRDPALIATPPPPGLGRRILCLFASTVEQLCRDLGLPSPSWCAGVGPLGEPWFVSGMENLKALALVESPPDFRKRNLFVLGNFLDRV